MGGQDCLNTKDVWQGGQDETNTIGKGVEMLIH